MAATGKKTADLPPAVWTKIDAAIRQIGYGAITVIVQDGRAIQIEINEKIRLTGGNTMAVKPEATAADIGPEIKKALAGLEYGQLVILIKDGKVTQIDRTEKKRLSPLEGLAGDGI